MVTVVVIVVAKFTSPLLLTLAMLAEGLLPAVALLASELRSSLPVLPFRRGVTVSGLILPRIGEDRCTR